MLCKLEELNQNQLLHLTIDHELQQQNQIQQPVIAASFLLANTSAQTKAASSEDLNRVGNWQKFGGKNNVKQLSRRQTASLDVPRSNAMGVLRRPRSQVSPSSLAGPPKLVQWAKEAVQYYEGSTLVLSCSLAMSIAQGNPLKFTWFKQGKQLSSSSSNNNNNNNLFSNTNSNIINNNNRLSIETLADYSFLRLADLRFSDSGAYTCAASNSYGQEDRTTTQVIVNGGCGV